MKKGAHADAVQRQHTGTAVQVENAQVAVYLTHAVRSLHWTITPD
ncbi:hypothetical protein ABZX12_26450 [Kribbella sp. NPDC003505]